MTKIVLVETVSMFKHIYAVELNDDEPVEYALDDVASGEKGLDEFAQEHIAENIFSHRVVTEEEYIKVFDDINDYMRQWTPEEKKKYIYKRDKE